MDTYADTFAGSGADIETFLLRRYEIQMRSDEFKNVVITPKAHELAQTIIRTIMPQLNILSQKGLTTQAAKDFGAKRTKELEKVLAQAYVLRGRIHASPDLYRGSWTRAGEKVDGTTMEELRPGKGEQEVAWSVSPSFTVATKGSAGKEVVCRAKVFSRPV